ncbi:MAG: hypothetical protein JXM79_04975 [Sedimentisphaerales bacterium]|nr:hypothetical protein [Sedimentisphaerales bacterium]
MDDVLNRCVLPTIMLLLLGVVFMGCRGPVVKLTENIDGMTTALELLKSITVSCR